MLNAVKSSKAGKKLKQKVEEPTKPAELNSAEPKIDSVSGPAGSRRTFVLIAVLALVTLFLLILALAPSLKLNLKTTPTPTPYVSPAHTVLKINLPVASTSSTWTSDISIDTGSNKIAAVDLEILYGPKAITQVDIKPGTFFKDPVILNKKINPAKGTISYVLGVGLGQKAVSGKGTLATITFSKVTGATGQTGLVFLSGTGVSASGEIVSVLKTVTNAVFPLTSPTPVK